MLQRSERWNASAPGAAKLEGGGAEKRKAAKSEVEERVLWGVRVG
jgi:hypothetical protein